MINNSKRTIEWHKSCRKGGDDFHAGERSRALSIIAACDRHLADSIFYAYQIETAEKIGVLEFDRDKFLKKRTKLPLTAPAGVLD